MSANCVQCVTSGHTRNRSALMMPIVHWIRRSACYRLLLTVNTQKRWADRSVNCNVSAMMSRHVMLFVVIPAHSSRASLCRVSSPGVISSHHIVMWHRATMPWQSSPLICHRSITNWVRTNIVTHALSFSAHISPMA